MSTVPRPARPSPVQTQAGRPQLVTEDCTLSVPPSAYTLEGFRSWVASEEFPDRIRATFVNGEVTLDMSQEELQTHNKVKGEVTRVLLTLNRGADLGESYVDGARV